MFHVALHLDAAQTSIGDQRESSETVAMTTVSGVRPADNSRLTQWLLLFVTCQLHEGRKDGKKRETRTGHIDDVLIGA
jgi:hypothetical protein